MKAKLLSVMAAVLIILVGLLLGNFLGNQKEPMKKRSSPPRVQSLQTRTVKNTEVAVSIPISGLLTAYDEIDLYAEVSGVLQSTPRRFLEGQAFKEGEVLIRIDDAVYKHNLMAQRSQLLNQLTLLLPDLSIDFPRSQSKWEDYLSRFRIDDTVLPLPPVTDDKERYYLAARNIYTSYYNIKSMEATHAKYTLEAPFNGIVTHSAIKPGTLVRAGQRLGAFTSTDLLELESPVPIFCMDHIPLNGKVQLGTDDLPGSFEGRISRVNRVIDRDTMALKVYVQLTDPRLKPGMYLSGEMTSLPFENVVKIKRDLLLDGDQIYRVSDHTLVLQPVQIIGDAGDQVLVQGLPDGITILDEVWKEAREGKKIPRPVTSDDRGIPDTR